MPGKREIFFLKSEISVKQMDGAEVDSGKR